MNSPNVAMATSPRYTYFEDRDKFKGTINNYFDCSKKDMQQTKNLWNIFKTKDQLLYVVSEISVSRIRFQWKKKFDTFFKTLKGCNNNASL